MSDIPAETGPRRHREVVTTKDARKVLGEAFGKLAYNIAGRYVAARLVRRIAAGAGIELSIVDGLAVISVHRYFSATGAGVRAWATSQVKTSPTWADVRAAVDLLKES